MWKIPCLRGLKTEKLGVEIYGGYQKHTFIVPTEAHNYKIIGMLKQLKFRHFFRHVSVQAGTIIRELSCA